MPDYSKGKIYTIRNRNDNSLIYVGSTIQPLSVRWGGHKGYSLKHHNMLLYQSINNNWDEWHIELYENYPCNNKEELCKREGQVIREIATLNTRIEGRTRQEYLTDNVEIIKEKNKQYRNDNAYKIKEKKKQYHIDNADKIATKNKKYYSNNADIIKEQKKKEYWDNADKIKCECGGYYVSCNQSKHYKTKKHQQYLSTLQE